MNIRTGLLSIGFLLSCSVSMAQDRSNHSPLYLASQYLGKQIDITAQLVRITLFKTDSIHPPSSFIPFPIDSVVIFVSVKIDSAVFKEVVGRSGETKIYKRSFSVYLDKDSGRLLKIESNITSSTRDVMPDPALTILEQRLLSQNIDYSGLPDSIYTSFMDVIENCPYSPHLADRISAIYILDSADTEKEAKPIWVISLIGMPPIKISGRFEKSVPLEMRNFIRIEIDGITGKTLRASN